MTGPAFSNNRYFHRVPPGTGSGPVAGDALLAVPNIAALVALDDTTIDDGGEVSVKSVRDEWFLDKTSALAPDGITIVAAPTAGNWIRKRRPDPAWQLQANWYVDAVGGYDENSGASSLAALATWGEYQRRVGEGPLTVSHTITFLSAIEEDIPVNTAAINESVDITLQGVRSAPLYSGSVTAKQALNAAANVDLQITDAGLPVSWTASGLVDKMYVLTSGPNVGACGWIVLDLGAKVARITKAYNEGLNSYVEPAVGETFDVVNLGFIAGRLFGVEGGNVRVVVRDLRFSSPGADVFVTKGGDWQLLFCDFDGRDINLSGSPQESSSSSAVSVFATRLSASGFILVERATANIYAAFLASGVSARTHGSVFFKSDNVFQYKSGPALMRANGGTRLVINSGGTLGVFGLAAAGNRALYVSANSIGVLAGYLYGYGNTFDYAVEVGSGSNVVYASGFKPVVTAGALSDTLIGNMPRVYAALPASNLTRMCGMVVE